MKFRPSLPATVALAAVAAACAWLGNWQWQRAAEKQALLAEIASAPRLAGLAAPADELRFARVTLSGRFDPRRHVLVDNRVSGGRAGVHVLTPFTTAAGQSVLVNRGWLAMPPDRRSLPGVPTSPEPVRISGMLDALAPPGRQLGPDDRLQAGEWPQLVTYPEPDAIAAALGTELYPWVLLLDPDSAMGFGDRAWQPVVITPARHRGYAFQWYALALTAAVIWLLLGLRRGRSPSTGSET